MNKFIAIILITAIFFSSSVFAGRPAKAVLSNTVTDFLIEGWNLITWAAEEVWEYAKKNYDKMLRDVIAKRLLDYVVNETVKWIQGGGEPKFIGNWEGFVEDAGDIAFDSVVRETSLAKLCTPFGLQVQIGLLPVGTFGDRITCTLDKVVSNIENFYVDFSVGGWNGYLVSLEPENNFYGAMLLANDEAVLRTTKKKGAAKTEGLAGSGFMGDKQCKAGSGKTKEIVDKTELDDAMDSEEGKACESTYDTCVASAESESKKESCYSTYEGCMYKAATHTDVGKAVAKDEGYAADRTGEYCDPKDMVDATPGSMIGKSVGEAITSDAKWAANIESWVSALVNAVINRVIKEGMKEMKEITSDKKDSYYPEGHGESKDKFLDSLSGDMVGIIKDIRDVNGWQYLLDTKKESISLASSTLAAFQEMEEAKATAPSGSYALLVCEPSETVVSVPAGDIIFPAVTSTVITVQSEIDKLTGEIGDLQIKLDEANGLITEIEDVDSSDTAQVSMMQEKVKQFKDKYGSPTKDELLAVQTNQEAADAEKQAKQDELTAVEDRLSACKTAISSAP